MTADLKSLSDETLIARYEGIRRQADADRDLGAEFRLVSEGTRHYAETVQREIERRGLRFTPVEWG